MLVMICIDVGPGEFEKLDPFLNSTENRTTSVVIRQSQVLNKTISILTLVFGETI